MVPCRQSAAHRSLFLEGTVHTVFKWFLVPVLTVFIASGLPYSTEDDNRDQVDTEEIQSHFLFASGSQHAPLAPLQMGVV